VEIQPQLVLLQKTLLNVEGMGRELDPNLDLWQTAKPFLEKWMHQRVGLRGLRQRLDQEASQWAQILPQIPRLAYARLNHPDPGPAMRTELERLRRAQDRSNRLLAVLCGILAAGLGVAVWALTRGGGV